MKIFMTGMTPLQIASPRAGRIQKINNPKALVELLREMGHAVEWRATEVGEPIQDDFDLQIVNVGPINSINARMGGLGALWALSCRMPTIVHFDDWQVDATFNAMNYLINRREKQIFKVIKGEPFFRVNYYDPCLPAYAERLLETAQEFRSTWTRWLALCPMYYGWGDKEIARRRLKFVPLENFSFLDFTSLVIPDYKQRIECPEPKERVWTTASVMPHHKWIERCSLSWPVRLFGTTKKDVREGRITTLPNEAAVRREYGKTWGILSPEYGQSGAGWWRSRFVYSCQVGSVLYCGSKDGQALGPAYCVKSSQVESASDSELKVMAQRQVETFLPCVAPKDILVQQTELMLSRSKELFSNARRSE